MACPVTKRCPRYYANSALDSIHRAVAVELWSRYQGRALTSEGLDTALAAFDMFVLHDQEQDLDYVRSNGSHPVTMANTRLGSTDTRCARRAVQG